jgi:ATP-dependent DNA helicase RecG
MVHGRLPGPNKDRVMNAFRSNHLHILLATSLIEVGVDVPNATSLVVENAEQFGLAQLHQLRGRIGRGAHESYCILVSGGRTREARERLQVLEKTSDGFEIAEADLKLRGPGELLGRQQSGDVRFRFAELDRDLELVRQARDLALRILEQQPG